MHYTIYIIICIIHTLTDFKDRIERDSNTE